MDDRLKLLALDDADLTIVSAHIQDSILKANDIQWLGNEGKLVVALNRFTWERKPRRRLFSKVYERRRAIMHFDRVLSVRTRGIALNSTDEVLSLLAVQFWPLDEAGSPGGAIELSFSDDKVLEAKVECIECRLSDLGAAWGTGKKPIHSGSAS